MIDECKVCASIRHCINGHYCTKTKKYVEYSKSKECKYEKL